MRHTVAEGVNNSFIFGFLFRPYTQFRPVYTRGPTMEDMDVKGHEIIIEYPNKLVLILNSHTHTHTHTHTAVSKLILCEGISTS